MNYPQITSRQNRLVREAAALGSRRSRRQEERRFLCEGARLCRDAALSGVKVDHCFFTPRAGEAYGEYLKPVLSAAQEVWRIEDHVAALLSSTKTPQGIFCVCRLPDEPREGRGLSGPCVVLEDLQDPGNLGTVLRTAEALGVEDVVLLGDCCDPFSPKALRASMGAVFRLCPQREPDPKRLRDRLKEKGYRLHAAVPDTAANRVTDLPFDRGLHAVWIGNEGNGLSPQAIALCDDRVTIPMTGRAESLNASAAATILLWEMKRNAKAKEILVKGAPSHG